MIRDLAQRAIEAALREWWITNTIAWCAVIVFAMWLDGWFT